MNNLLYIYICMQVAIKILRGIVERQRDFAASFIIVERINNYTNEGNKTWIIKQTNEHNLTH